MESITKYRQSPDMVRPMASHTDHAQYDWARERLGETMASPASGLPIP